MKYNNKILGLTFLLCVSFMACKKNEIIVNDIVSNLVTGPKEILSTASYKLIIMDYDGNIIKQKILGTGVLNFQRWTVGDNIRYSYLSKDTISAIPNAGYVPGSEIILDSNFNEIKSIRLLASPDHNPLLDALDGHDFILIDDNHYIAEAYYEKVVNNIPDSLYPALNCKVIVPIIQEVQNGEVIWEWDASNYPEFYSTSVEGNVFSNNTIQHDYVHLNSMYIDPKDNNLICSFRNLDQVVKISRKTGNIIWRLGGKNSDFALSSNQKFMRQHYATLTDNNQTLLIYDNGDASLRPYTRVDEFKLDEINKTIISSKMFNLPGNMFSQFKGSVQKTDSSYFIGDGDKRCLEINYNTNKIIFDKQLPGSSYRVLRY